MAIVLVALAAHGMMAIIQAARSAITRRARQHYARPAGATLLLE